MILYRTIHLKYFIIALPTVAETMKLAFGARRTKAIKKHEIGVKNDRTTLLEQLLGIKIL